MFAGLVSDMLGVRNQRALDAVRGFRYRFAHEERESERVAGVSRFGEAFGLLRACRLRGGFFRFPQVSKGWSLMLVKSRSRYAPLARRTWLGA
jgi:hypothetical protein